MKLAIVYDPKCPKLKPDAYSQTYRDMFLALIDRFDSVVGVKGDCIADDISADAIIFYDIHSSHHVTIKGIEKHSAVKYTYFNDPWQIERIGHYWSGLAVHKLSREQRSARAIQRGIDYIICPYTESYEEYIAPHIGDKAKLLWFPVAPDIRRFKKRAAPITERKQTILLNGHTWEGTDTYKPYIFRRWAFTQKNTEKRHHYLADNTIPAGLVYPDFLAEYAGAMALCTKNLCPKYSEIPLAGCVCFAEYQEDYKRMGFRDGESCIYVNKKNYADTVNAFKHDVGSYQSIADAGRKIMEDNWTAKHFADHIYKHCQGVIDGDG